VEQEGEMNVEERLKQLIEYVKCPETGSEHFGEWGILTRSQRLFLDKLARDTLALLSAMDEKIRKIPENAVVLTREEYNLIDHNIKHLESVCNAHEKTIAYWEDQTKVARQELFEERKETAEKFAERLKEKLNEWLEDNEDLNGKIDFGIAMIELIGVKSLEGEVIAESLIDEICKEITESK
jgi:hypothetical protein